MCYAGVIEAAHFLYRVCAFSSIHQQTFVLGVSVWIVCPSGGAHGLPSMTLSAPIGRLWENKLFRDHPHWAGTHGHRSYARCVPSDSTCARLLFGFRDPPDANLRSGI